MKSICFALLCFLSFMQCAQKSPSYPLAVHNSTQSLPFSKVVSYQNLLFLSGQVGKDPNTKSLVEGGIEAETEQTLKNIQQILTEQGSSLDQVVKATVILADINDFEAMNTVYRKYFTHNLPARTTFAADLVNKAKIEIEVIAVKK